MYLKEQELVDLFIEKLVDDNPWDTTRYCTEFNYFRGKTDIIAVSSDNEVIAIEAKLEKWKCALHQAYRNQCFADKSYVLLPIEVAVLATQYEEEFNKRRVGLCSIEHGRITILKEALHNEPIQPWLKQAALQCTMEG